MRNTADQPYANGFPRPFTVHTRSHLLLSQIHGGYSTEAISTGLLIGKGRVLHSLLA